MTTTDLDEPLACDVTVDIGPSEPCRDCPGGNSCYMLTSSTLRNAYARGCRNGQAREANTAFAKQKRVANRPPDKSADPDENLWEKETPFEDADGSYSGFQWDSFCSVCGEASKALTMRGTLVRCETCSNDAIAEAAQKRIDDVLERYNTPRQRETEKPTQLSLEQQLDLTADCGQVCDAINIIIGRLQPDFEVGPSFIQRASRMIYRLELLQREFYSVGHNPTYEGSQRAEKAMTVLESEIAGATGIIGELDNAYRYVQQQQREIESRALPPARHFVEPIRQEPSYYTGPLYREPEPEPEPEYWPGEQLDGGPYYCQIAGHIGLAKAVVVLYLGYDREPGRVTTAEKLIFACSKHADVRKLLQAMRWAHCWNLETINDED